MKIGMESDPLEDLDREIERAVAAAAKVQFGGQGDITKALAEVHRLSRRQLDWDRPEMILRA